MVEISVEDEGPGHSRRQSRAHLRPILFRAAAGREIRPAFRAGPVDQPADRRGAARPDHRREPARRPRAGCSARASSCACRARLETCACRARLETCACRAPPELCVGRGRRAAPKLRLGAFFAAAHAPHFRLMQIHASCAAVTGPGCCCWGRREPASPTSCCDCSTAALNWSPTTTSRSRMALARPAGALAGLLEVRGLGIVRLPLRRAGAPGTGGRSSGAAPERLPHAGAASALDLPLLTLDPDRASGARARRCWRWTARSAGSPGWPEPSGMSEPTAAPAGGPGQRPLGRRQGHRSCARWRISGYEAVDNPPLPHARGAGGRAEAGSGESGGRRRCTHPRLRCRRWCWPRPAAAAAPIPRCDRSWSSPGPTRPRCCAATPRHDAAIRWRRTGRVADGIAAEQAADRAAARGAPTW